MAHELEQLADGRHAFASAREVAWHGLGTVVDHKMTPEEALQLTGMAGWNVRKEPNVTLVPGGKCQECGVSEGDTHNTVCVTGDESAAEQEDGARVVLRDDTCYPVAQPGGYGIIRDNPVTSMVEGFGQCGSDRTFIQNEDALRFLLTVTDQSGAVVETLGSLRDGRSVFFTVLMPEGLTVGGRDEVGLYLTANNYHDSGCFRLDVTPVRVVCANTQRAAIRDARSTYKIYHRSGAQARIQEAREALDLVWNYKDAFQFEADKLIKKRITVKQFEEMMTAVWPEKFAETSRADWKEPVQAHWDAVVDLYKNQPTQENCRRTAYGAYQSIVEYLDWEIPVLGEEAEKANEVRAIRNFTGSYDDRKNKAFELAQAIG